MDPFYVTNQHQQRTAQNHISHLMLWSLLFIAGFAGGLSVSFRLFIYNILVHKSSMVRAAHTETDRHTFYRHVIFVLEPSLLELSLSPLLLLPCKKQLLFAFCYTSLSQVPGFNFHSQRVHSVPLENDLISFSIWNRVLCVCVFVYFYYTWDFSPFLPNARIDRCKRTECKTHK